MLARLDAYRPHALLLTVPVTLLWTSELGVAMGAVVVLLHAAAVLFLSAHWTRRDLAAALDPRLALTRDRFSVDRETLDLAAALLAVVCVTLTITLLIAAFPVGLYAAFVLASALWIASLPARKRYVRLEVIAPVVLLIAPAMLLRAPAWRDDAAPAISAAAHAVAWLVGALMLAQILLTMTRDREADRAAGVYTSISVLSRPAAVGVVAFVFFAITLLAAIGVAWWGALPLLFAGWTAAAVLALLCVRWDSWAVSAGALGGGLTAITAALAVI